MNIGPNIDIFDKWVNKTYVGNSRTKTITREKYDKICKLLRGESSQCNAKFRFWVRNKGFLLMKHDSETDEIKTDKLGELYVSLHAKEENSSMREYSIDKFLRTNLPAISFYRKVAVVDEFHDIIKIAHVDEKGSHAGQKKTYRLVSDMYAFLPREVITFFLLNCESCKPRIQKYGPVPKKKTDTKESQKTEIQLNLKFDKHNTQSRSNYLNSQVIEEQPIVHILDESGCITKHADSSCMVNNDAEKDTVKNNIPWTLVNNNKRGWAMNGNESLKRFKGEDNETIDNAFLLKQNITDERIKRLKLEEIKLMEEKNNTDYVSIWDKSKPSLANYQFSGHYDCSDKKESHHYGNYRDQRHINHTRIENKRDSRYFLSTPPICVPYPCIFYNPQQNVYREEHERNLFYQQHRKCLHCTAGSDVCHLPTNINASPVHVKRPWSNLAEIKTQLYPSKFEPCSKFSYGNSARHKLYQLTSSSREPRASAFIKVERRVRYDNYSPEFSKSYPTHVPIVKILKKNLAEESINNNYKKNGINNIDIIPSKFGAGSTNKVHKVVIVTD